MRKVKLKDKVYDPGMIKFAIIFATALFLAMGIFFIVVAFTYDKIEPAAIVCLKIAGVLSILAGMGYGIATPFLIYTYPKHKRIAHLFLKESVFIKRGE